MKKTLLIIFTILSLSVYGQNRKNIIKSIDTIQLNKTNKQNLVFYKIGDVKIAITKEEFLSEIQYIHKNYKNEVNEIDKEDSQYDFYVNVYEAIDSVYRKVEKEIDSEMSIDVSHKIFDELGLDILVNFKKYIDSGNCVVYDQNGIRQYQIIRNIVDWDCGLNCASEGKEYYFFNQSEFFYSALVWIT